MLTALIDCQADTDIPDDNGVTPLHLSVVNSFDEMTRALIHNKADINIQDKDGVTPSHRSILDGKVQLAET